MQDRTRTRSRRLRAESPGAPLLLRARACSPGYLSDIELLLEEQRWEQALREAFDLPQIAAALSDPRMQVSVDRVQEWCEEVGASTAMMRRQRPIRTPVGSPSSSASAPTARVSPANRYPPWRCGVCGCTGCSARGTAASRRADAGALGPEAADAAQICTSAGARDAPLVRAERLSRCGRAGEPGAARRPALAGQVSSPKTSAPRRPRRRAAAARRARLALRSASSICWSMRADFSGTTG